MRTQIERFAIKVNQSGAVKHLRITLRVAISLVAFTAYVAAADHCSIAPAVEKVAHIPAHEGCPGHDSPDQNGKSNDTVCCKTFPPVSFIAAKSLTAFDTHSFTLQFYSATVLVAAERAQSELRPLELDTGPPFAESFAESVLQRSILAHAPPFVA